MEEIASHSPYDFITKTVLHERILGWIALFLIAGCALFVIYRIIAYFLWRGKEDTLSPYEKALKKIREANPKYSKTSEDFRPFYFATTLALKEFLNDELNMQVAHLTDAEFVAFLHETGRVPHTEMLLHIFGGIERVKFAGDDAAPAEAQHDYELAIDFLGKIQARAGSSKD